MSRKVIHLLTVLSIILVFTFTGQTPALAAAPTNDNFDSAEVISSSSFTTTVDVTEAATEPDEPQPCDPKFQTVWYSFTPSTNMVLRADVEGSAIEANLTVYRVDGPGITGLAYLSCTGTGYLASTFSVEAGRVYYFQVGSRVDSTAGNLQLNLEEILPPANDNFAQAADITALPFSATVDNGAAILETDEPQNCAWIYNTVWYSFTPAETMLLLADTEGSTISTKINVFRATGSGITDLEFITCTEYESGVFQAEAGEQYYLQAGGLDSAAGVLDVNLRQVITPPNDNFADAVDITSLPFSSSVDMSVAGVETDEPFACNSTARTVWYSFTATETMIVGGDIQGDVSYSQVNVYADSGGGMAGLTPLECKSANFAFGFTAEAGQTYYIQVGTSDVGVLQFNFKQLSPPENDDFAQAEQITSLPYNGSLDITDARVEPGEILHWCTLMDRTAWYSFTPTETMLVRVDTEGSAIEANLNIYQSFGPGVGDLNILACTFSSGPYSFIAEAGQTYYFQAGGVGGDVGSMQINLQQLPSIGNDDFANATIISTSLPFDDTVDTNLMTRETGEPTSSCAAYGPNRRSAWYAFTPATSGAVAAHVSAGFTPVIAVYTGTSFDDLSEIGCQVFSNNYLLLQANAGTTYYFQIDNLYPWESGGSLQFHLGFPPPPQVDFSYNPSLPSVFDTIQFCDTSYDPGNMAIESFEWNFGDGASSTESCEFHRYATDGSYTVQHSITTSDGRTASISRVVEVRTHDVTLTKIEVPESTRVGKPEKITVSVNNPTAYTETIIVDLYRSIAGGGFEWIDSITMTVPAGQKPNKATAFNFRYTFTSEDAALGKVVFRAIATIANAPDAFPQDNEAISSRTFVRPR